MHIWHKTTSKFFISKSPYLENTFRFDNIASQILWKIWLSCLSVDNDNHMSLGEYLQVYLSTYLANQSIFHHNDFYVLLASSAASSKFFFKLNIILWFYLAFRFEAPFFIFLLSVIFCRHERKVRYDTTKGRSRGICLKFNCIPSTVANLLETPCTRQTVNGTHWGLWKRTDSNLHLVFYFLSASAMPKCVR